MGTVVSLLLSRKINTLSLGEEVCIGAWAKSSKNSSLYVVINYSDVWP